VPDTTLEAAFPDQIDGQPVTDLTSFNMLSFYQDWGTAQEKIDAFIAAMQSIGVNPASVSIGSASATVGGTAVTLEALRVAGGSAAAVWAQLIRLDTDAPPVLTAGNLGGKQVTIATTSGGDVSYSYFNGEYAWLLSMTDAQAAVVLAAVP
jgi:hypothetical protein